MSRRTTQRSAAQSLALVLVLLLFAIAAVIAVRGVSHGSGDRADAAVGSTLIGLEDLASSWAGLGADTT